MKIAIFMSDTRSLDSNKETSQYNSCAAFINALYCAGHKYDFYYFQPYLHERDSNSIHVCKDPNTSATRHASWTKILSAILLSKSDKKYDYVVYIDSDCVFFNFQKTIESVINDYPDKDFIIANNSPYHPQLPCCAFFICKNTEWSQSFLVDWYTHKNPESDSNEWKDILKIASTTYNTPYFPIGTYWEQDTMWLLYQNPSIAPHIQLLSETIMHDESEEQYLIHISHERAQIRKPYLLGYVEHLEKLTNHTYQDIISSITRISYDTSCIIFDSHSH